METGIDDSKNPTENQLISEDEPTASLPMDEDMEDILEHIEEDVDLNDEEDEDEDLLESDPNTVTENDIVTKKEVNEMENKLSPSPFPTLPLPPTLNSNGLQSNPGPLPKLPPLPPLPPPLLNLEFLKVKAREILKYHYHYFVLLHWSKYSFLEGSKIRDECEYSART